MFVPINVKDVWMNHQSQIKQRLKISLTFFFLQWQKANYLTLGDFKEEMFQNIKHKNMKIKN